MNTLKHPSNKFERKIAKEKHTLDNEKKVKRARADRVRRKLLVEYVKEKETSDELQELRTG